MSLASLMQLVWLQQQTDHNLSKFIPCRHHYPFFILMSARRENSRSDFTSPWFQATVTVSYFNSTDLENKVSWKVLALPQMAWLCLSIHTITHFSSYILPWTQPERCNSTNSTETPAGSFDINLIWLLLHNGFSLTLPSFVTQLLYLPSYSKGGRSCMISEVMTLGTLGLRTNIMK